MTDARHRALYMKVANELRSQIASGTLAVGDPIPSTKQLEQRHGVSTTVVRAAVSMLRNEGLLQGQPGKAVYVIAKPEDVQAEKDTVEDLARQVAELRNEVRRLAQLVPSSGGRDLAAEVAELRALVEQLYNRLGHPLPSNDDNVAQHQPKRRHTGS